MLIRVPRKTNKSFWSSSVWMDRIVGEKTPSNGSSAFVQEKLQEEMSCSCKWPFCLKKAACSYWSDQNPSHAADDIIIIHKFICCIISWHTNAHLLQLSFQFDTERKQPESNFYYPGKLLQIIKILKLSSSWRQIRPSSVARSIK